MKFEETIQSMFDRSPMLFTERWQCLDHLFLVIGNGYEWSNGQLVYTSEEDLQQPNPVLGQEEKASLNEEKARKSLESWYKEIYQPLKQLKRTQVAKSLKEELHEKTTEEKEKIIDQILEKELNQLVTKEIERHLKPKPISFYPLYSSNLLFSFPTDIQPDWLEGIKETIGLVLENMDDDTSAMNDYQKQEYERSCTLLHQLAKTL